MKTTAKKLIMIMLLIFITGSSIALSKSVQASAKAVSKVTKTITLTSSKNLLTHKLSIGKKEKVFAKVKILEVKGKVTVKNDDLYLGEYEFMVYENKKMTDGGKGSFWAEWTKPKLSKSSFVKGKTLQASKEDYISGSAAVEWNLLNGLKKLKLKVTYFTKSGKKGIKSIK